ncbi:hypothetical protein DPMN_170865 [Dreissena polymorpha]|uniref:Uncharacterized protein n=1 Tax=Dreissena polymorpha TaxID=45954 RepID=A0A9D4E0L7_DREPO|nr:hypothetical protein DPMN_170865 [Dreissena polymorpha]
MERTKLIGSNLQGLFKKASSNTSFQEDWTINVTSRVGNVFKRTGTIFKLSRDIIRTNVRTKFHEYWTINVTSRVLTRFCYSNIRNTSLPPGGHVFQRTGTILKLS